MAVTKIWAVHDGFSRVLDYCGNPEKTEYSDLEQVLLYASDAEKTEIKNEKNYAVTGINCHAENAATEMLAVQKRFGKTGGNIAYHAYQSFKPGEVSAKECHEIGVELARRIWGDHHQVLVATHYNTGTFHNHFVVNSVGMWDGRKLEAKYENYYKLRRESDRICKERGLSVVEDPQAHKTARSVYFAEKNSESTRFNLMREALDKALSLSSSWTEMTTVLKKLGYDFESGPYHKYAVIRPIGSKKYVRTFRLGDKYDKESLEARLIDNQRDYRIMHNYFEFLDPYTKEYARVNPPTEMYYRKRDFYFKAPRVTGYISFFHCVAIVLGIAPIYEDQYQKPLSAECRAACRQLDRYTNEVTLICQEQLDTPQDIQEYIVRVNTEIDEVAALRSKIRNKQRNCNDPVQMEELKRKCSACTAVLAELRKKKKTAMNIIEDNPKLSELLESEFEARLENDPYLSGREKRAIKEQKSLVREENNFDR